MYIVWVKGKEVTHKNPPRRMFHWYLVGWPYSRDNREIDSLTRLFSLQSCASHIPFSQELFLQTSCELVVKLHWFFNTCLIFHELNTKPNTIKFHKIQGTKLMQLQHFLSWNKANIKHSCKSRLYQLSLGLFHDKTSYNRL